MEPNGGRTDADSWRVLVQGITDHAIFLLDAGGHVLAWNAGAEAVLGFSAEEMLGTHCSRLYTPADVDRDRPRQQLTAASSVGCVEEDGWRVRKDGSTLWAHATIRPVRDEAGRLVGFANILSDALRPSAGDRLALLAERERIAAELHGRTMRTFFGIGLQLNGVANRVDDPEIGRLLDECTRRLDEGIGELRRLAFDLGHGRQPAEREPSAEGEVRGTNGPLQAGPADV